MDGISTCPTRTLFRGMFEEDSVLESSMARESSGLSLLDRISPVVHNLNPTELSPSQERCPEAFLCWQAGDARRRSALKRRSMLSIYLVSIATIAGVNFTLVYRADSFSIRSCRHRSTEADFPYVKRQCISETPASNSIHVMMAWVLVDYVRNCAFAGERLLEFHR